MREIVSFAAEPRARAGKGTARATRRTGRVPGVVYGNKRDPELISVAGNELLKEMYKGGFFNRLLDLEVGGAKQRVLPRDVQLDPVSDRPVHVDFLRVAADARLRIMLPTHFTGQEASPGIKRGGVLNVVRHEIECYCAANAIPEYIDVDLAGLDIGDSVHIKSVPLPAGVKTVIADRNFTVATVAAPTLLTEAEEKPVAAEGVPVEGEEGAAPAEGEAAAEGKTAAPAGGKAPAGKAPAEAKGKAPAGDKGKAPAAGDKGKAQGDKGKK